jgi:hypothetical protein
MIDDGDGDKDPRARLRVIGKELRAATAAALAMDCWFAPALDDCRVDVERMQALGAAASVSAVQALLARADLTLRTWHELALSTRPLTGAWGLRRCPLCSDGVLRPVARRGRTVPFRGIQIEIPADFAIPTCDRCDAESLDPDTAAALDAHLLSAWVRGH